MSVGRRDYQQQWKIEDHLFFGRKSMDYKQGHALDLAEAARSGARAYAETLEGEEEDEGGEEAFHHHEETETAELILDREAGLIRFEEILVDAIQGYCEANGLPLLDRPSVGRSARMYLRLRMSKPREEEEYSPYHTGYGESPLDETSRSEN